MSSFKELKVWQKAVDFVTEIYEVTDMFDKSEKYALTSQLRRASVSVPSNIAEGSQKQSKADFIRYINIARGSIAEIETQLIIANRLNYISEIQLKKFGNDLKSIGAMLLALRNSMQTTKLRNVVTS
jgi:four helix bundle protein